MNKDINVLEMTQKYCPDICGETHVINEGKILSLPAAFH